MLQDDKRLRAVAVLLASASAVMVIIQNARLAVLWDLSYVLENAMRIAAGDVPYRDFPFPYPPFTFVMQAVIVRVFGREALHHTVYAAIACAAATVLAFSIAQTLTRSLLVSSLLTFPLSILGIYCILPHPFYDPDCCLAVLAIVALILRATTPRRLFIAAALVPLPLLIKQNIGAGFVAGFVILVLLSRNRERIVTGLAGLACGIVVVIAGIAAVFGIDDYVHWTVRYAAAKRLPPIAEQLAPLLDPIAWICAATIVTGAIIARRQRVVGALLIAAPWLWTAVRFVITDDPLEPEINLLRTWPIVMIVSVAAAAAFFRDAWPERGVPLLIVATIYGAFLSQGTWGSTYGIWPLLFILLAWCARKAPVPAVLATLITAVALLGAVPYVTGNSRLAYAKLDGTVRTSSLPQLRGLHVAGEWLPDFEELVAWTDRTIPRDDGIVCFPGEDLFYFTTGRRPRFPVLMFDRTVNPYSADEIVGLIGERHIRWIIVKKRLQVNGDPMPELPAILRLLGSRFAIVARLRNYDVYIEKRGEAGL